MIDQVSIIIGDRNPHHHILEKTAAIIKERFSGGFTVNDITSLDLFSNEEKEYIENMFSNNVTEVDAWEHSFHLDKDTSKWKYNESLYHNNETIKYILMLLNTSKTSIGEIVDTNDYRFIKNLWRNYLNLLDYETRWVLYEYHYFDEKEFIEFACYNLKSRIGDSCIFNFEFLKTFMEAKSDYNAKKILEAILGKEARS